MFDGIWQIDKASGLTVFRQNEDSMMETKDGVEVWSDGSYYYGSFKEGIK